MSRRDSMDQTVPQQVIQRAASGPKSSNAGTLRARGRSVSNLLGELDSQEQLQGDGLDKESMKRITPGSLRRRVTQVQRHVRMDRIINGVRVLQEDCSAGASVSSSLFSSDSMAWTINKVATVVPGSPDTVFKIVMNVESMPLWDAAVDYAQVVEEIDENTAILHIVYKAPGGSWSLWPLWTRPRDLCISRHWRREDDGSYIIIYQSVEHHACPPQPGYVRADLKGGGYTIAPSKARKPKGTKGSAATGGAIPAPPDMALVTFILHIDLRSNKFSLAWQRLKGVNVLEDYLMNVIGIRDVLQHAGFVSVHLADDPLEDSEPPPVQEKPVTRQLARVSSYRPNEWEGNEVTSPATTSLNSSLQGYTGTCPIQYWDSPDIRGIKVRGKTYATDKKKVYAEQPAFALAGVDFFEMPAHQEHIAQRPETLVSKLGDHVQFMFIVQLMVPGPPCLSMVLYFAPTETSPTRDDNTPFSNTMAAFLDGTDEQRTDRFKIIPRVVQGSWIVKQTVGNTPTILGRKLRQPYHMGANYIEVDIDIASSSVASAVLGVCGPVAKSLVVDILFLLEGWNESELPEKVLGAVRLRNIDLKAGPTKIY